MSTVERETYIERERPTDAPTRVGLRVCIHQLSFNTRTGGTVATALHPPTAQTRSRRRRVYVANQTMGRRAWNTVVALVLLHMCHVHCVFTSTNESQHDATRAVAGTSEQGGRRRDPRPHPPLSKRTSRYWVEGERPFDRAACVAAIRQYRSCWGGAACLHLRHECDRLCPLKRACIYTDLINSDICKEFGWATRC